jgi:hypothetical protein
MANTFVGDNDHGDKVLPLSDLLWEEVTKLRQDKVRLEEDIVHFANELNEIKDGFEGCCNACEPVGLMNKKLREERDEARRMYCVALSSEGVERPLNGVYDISVYNEAKLLAQKFGWDCFKEENTNG